MKKYQEFKFFVFSSTDPKSELHNALQSIISYYQSISNHLNDKGIKISGFNEWFDELLLVTINFHNFLDKEEIKEIVSNDKVQKSNDISLIKRKQWQKIFPHKNLSFDKERNKYIFSKTVNKMKHLIKINFDSVPDFNSQQKNMQEMERIHC